jgi:transcriptional regulator with XRE-family HTH domain
MTGAEIRTLRERLGLSQVDFGRLLNVRGMTVSRWERDDARPEGAAAQLLEAMKRRTDQKKLPANVGEVLLGALAAGAAVVGFVLLMEMLFGKKK